MGSEAASPRMEVVTTRKIGVYGAYAEILLWQNICWWYWCQLRDVILIFFEVVLLAVISDLPGLIHLKKDRAVFSYQRRRISFNEVQASK